MCIAIETDAMLQRTSLRESLRLRPELLRRLGWHYARVHAFELFSDPDAVASRIATMLGADPAPITEPIAIVSTASADAHDEVDVPQPGTLAGPPRGARVGSAPPAAS